MFWYWRKKKEPTLDEHIDEILKNGSALRDLVRRVERKQLYKAIINIKHERNESTRKKKLPINR